ncbi:MAG: pyruvate kinase [Gemmataceae bacterium]|nr:pyruvate kinase [Gemmataceae bacterium]
MQRRTRIVATLGPATDRPGVLEKLLDFGLDVARINFSHGTSEEHRGRIDRFRLLAAERKRVVAVLGDLPGPKLRAILKASIELIAGSKLTLALKPEVAADVHLTEPEALAKVKPNHRVLLDDGRIQARVHLVAKDIVTLMVEVGGTLLPNKGINLPDSELTIPAVTKRDRDAVAVALGHGVDWLALSFVRDASAAHELRGVIRGYNVEIPILAKMERPEAVRDGKSDEIIAAFDGIMVARGDLGVEIALEKVPHVQKQLIQKARLAGKPVITATDMLDSMRKNPRPTRAEVSDVANAVYDGTDAVMLSGETAVGDYPVEALSSMNRILIEAETHQEESGPKPMDIPRGDITDHITHAVCDLARDTGADAIITPTLTGRTARLVARHRVASAIIAVSTEQSVVQRLAVVWGVQGVTVPFPIQRGDDRLEAAVRASFLAGVVKPGSLVVVLAGHPIEGGEGFPTIRLVRVGDDGRSCEP